MTTFEFTITLTDLVDDLDAINVFYGHANDASIESSAGKTLVHFDRDAETLDEALRQAVADVQQQGWTVREITVEPHCLTPISTA